MSMFTYLARVYFPDLMGGDGGGRPEDIPPPTETPALGCLHPDYCGGAAFFDSPAKYMKCVHRRRDKRERGSGGGGDWGG